MTTWQQNYKLLQDATEDLVTWSIYWSKKPTLLLISVSLVIIMTLAGGLFFWVSQFSNVFANHSSDQSELELARSGLQTMKRMVGDQRAWSESIQEEYNRLFSAQLIKTEPLSYGDVIGQNY